MTHDPNVIKPTYTRTGVRTAAPRLTIPDAEMNPGSAYQMVHDEAMLDGNARLNLATFVATWMGDDADRLYAETYDKNMVDKDEYPRTAAIEEHCWHILASLWSAPDVSNTIGTSTIGSSEACMLGGLAFKRRWQLARRAAGKPTDKPNLIMSSAVQVCWEKFCNYFEVEPRYVPVTDEHPMLDGSQLEQYVDENTIGVVAIMGVTYTGMYEPVKEIAAALDALQAKTGFDVPIHVDGASGAMIAPFLQPELEWDFRLERVHSISTSGHKYGLVYPGVGWIVWRTLDALPDELIFRVSYLGGDMPTLALNFSRPGAQVLLQYYQFLRLGREGYTAIQQECQDVAQYIAKGISEIGAVRPVERRLRHPGVRVAAEVRLHRQLEPLPPLRPAAHEGLAGAGVPVARQHERPHRATHRRAQRAESRSRRRPARRHPHRDGVARCARYADAHPRAEARVPPLSAR